MAAVASAAAEAAAAARDAACARLSAIVAERAVASVKATFARWRTVRLRLSADRWCRFSADWDGGTLRLETQPPNVQRDFKHLHGSEKRRADAATAALNAAEVHAAKLQRRIDSAELIPKEVGTCDGGPCCVNLRKRRHAEKEAAEAAASEAAAVQMAEAARATAKTAEAEAKAATARAAKLEGAVEARRDAEKEAREHKKAVRTAEAAQAAAEVEAAEAEATAEAAQVAQMEAKAAQAEAEAAQAEAKAAQEAAEMRLQQCQERLSALKGALGIEPDRNVPSTSNHGRGVPFMRAAVTDRSAADVATALKLAGGTEFLRDLIETKEFASIKKETIEATAAKIQERWSPRLAVLLMSDLQLSRSQFEALRHYLSFEYDVDDDVYRHLVLYVNPYNAQHKVSFPSLAPRCQWEPERDAVFGKCGVESSADGMVSYVKDQRGAVAQMAADHWVGISSDVKERKRPLLVAGFGDATGGWRGSSITHFELGLCSWENTDVKQCSKSNLLPAALAEGDDGAENLRVRFQPVADGFDSLASGKPLTVELQSGRLEVPMDFTFCGDFQIHKAILGMSKYTSAIWCECDHDTTGMFRFRPMPATTWAEVLVWYNEIGCVVKTTEKVCELNHYSYEVLQGKPFKPFECTQPGCSYKAKTEKQWRGDVSAFENLEQCARKKGTLEHGRMHKRHRPFMRPMLKKTPPIRMSVDILHIVFINMFVTYVEATVLVYVVEFDQIGRQPIEAYLSSKKIPMKIVKANDVGEMKESLIGRDAKVFMEKAEEIIPELLCFIHTPKDAVGQTAAAAADVDSDEFTWEGDGGDGADHAPETLEAKVATKLAGAVVTRVAAAEPKGALLDKCVSLVKTNMSQHCSAEELRAKRGEIEAADLIAISVGSTLLAFAAFLINEAERQQVVTYLLELHRDVQNDRTKGLGSDLEAEVSQLASEANQSVMLTVAEANSARSFYAKRDYWIDASSPQNHATARTRPIPTGYLIMRKYPSEGESIHERDARFWDNFYALTRSFRRFESDTDSYREQRAVETFNAASQVGRDVN